MKKKSGNILRLLQKQIRKYRLTESEGIESVPEPSSRGNPVSSVLKISFFLHELHEIDVSDSVSLLEKSICSHYIARIIVTSYHLKRSVFPVLGFTAFKNCLGDLEIGIIILSVSDDEITLELPVFSFAQAVSACQVIIMNDVFQNRTVVDSVIGS